MAATSGPSGAARGTPYAESGAPDLRWRRVFPGEESQLGLLRRWLASLFLPCPARDDLLAVANELASNAICHTASGRGGFFAVEVTWSRSLVRVAVADGGGPAEPRVIEDQGAEHGRGLLLVRGLSVRTGFAGDQRGRLGWAEISWGDAAAPASASPQVPREAAAGEWEAALARRFASMPTRPGRSALSCLST
jgi:serine/threonine-protein kinase RsbW